ncbi:hypothetical protein GRI44_00895 [Altererythrobacter confluentis]|uniref:Uncharacterized protein n=1 Tax=Allopontixanthobacter confluentis TaxID=1849021 RepID=A0A6L7GCV6_9SPHN|nr:hypothetical protein [Allopontixanthobacter confluentis]MXP13316.1 hypothetical protein [Allopontixanthobacter confluentis]
MSQLAGPLDIILNDIERALDTRLWYAALAVTLSLPDICSLLELPPEEGWSKGWKYAGWFDRNLAQYHPEFTGGDCYKLRGGLLHNGRVRRDEARWDHIAFTTPDSPGRLHRCVFSNNGGIDETALMLDVEFFCRDVMEATRIWFSANLTNTIVQANLPNLLALRRDDIGRQVSGGGFLR